MPGRCSTTCSDSGRSATRSSSSIGSTPEMAPTAAARGRCVGWLAEVMEGAGLEGSYSLFLGGAETVGVPREVAIERVKDSVLLLDVMGFVDDEEVLAASPRNVFLDIDPGFGQMWKDLGLHDAFAGHDAFVTVGEKIGEPDCLIPTCGIEWVTSPHPIVLEEWPVAAGGTRFTSVGSWRGPYDPVEYEGRRFGLRAHELRKLIRLPSLVEAELELALEIDPADAADLEALQRERLDPRRSRRGRRRPGRLPSLHPGLARRADGGEGDVRRGPQRLVQRAQHRLPGQRQAGAGPGHRLQRALPERRGAGGLRRSRRRPRGDRGGSAPTGSATPAPRARSPPSTSRRRRCWDGCWSRWPA